jgi:aspartate-semialdehyde dehydrogenase
MLLNGRAAQPRSYPVQIAFNVLPQIDALDEQGISQEEARISHETRRVLGRDSAAINVTAVRVPVFYGHGFAVHAAFERPLTPAAAEAAWAAAPGLSLWQVRPAAPYPTPAGLAEQGDRVYIGRIRADLSRPNALNFWVVADNIRKCAALNAFSVAHILVNRLV